MTFSVVPELAPVLMVSFAECLNAKPQEKEYKRVWASLKVPDNTLANEPVYCPNQAAHRLVQRGNPANEAARASAVSERSTTSGRLDTAWVKSEGTWRMLAAHRFDCEAGRCSSTCLPYRCSRTTQAVEWTVEASTAGWVHAGSVSLTACWHSEATRVESVSRVLQSGLEVDLNLGRALGPAAEFPLESNLP
jgi:hypothetical protein